MTALLEVANLAVRLPVGGEHRTVLHDLSLTLDEGQTLGLVGESGSGKSMTARTIDRLLPAGAQVDGRVMFDGKSVYELQGKELRRYRAEGVSMIFQDPRAHINPVRRIGDFLTEVLRTNRGMRSDAAKRQAVELLAEVGIPDGERRLRQYPHQLSGGLLQRVMIASAVAAGTRMILADEPTTALDVTTQAEVMAILERLRREHGIAMLFITHDLELAAAVCDQTLVMYAGRVVDRQSSATLHVDPLHPYAAALVEARPDITRRLPRLNAIPGRPLATFEAPEGCSFAPRCRYVQDACSVAVPELRSVAGGWSRCRRADELRGRMLRDHARDFSELSDETTFAEETTA
jgi:oligopeptide/dipeptide ABC transporter ATP-binding protein